MDAFAQDLKQALRGLSRNPGFAFAAVACFALGIGANVVMFGIVDALFLRAPAHVSDPGRVVRVYVQGTYSGGETWVGAARSYPEYLAVAGRVPGFSDAATYWSTPISIGIGVRAEHADAVMASYSFFHLLGVQPQLGRLFGAADDRIGATPVAVLSDGYWARRFGRDPSVLGRTLDIGGMPCLIVGVAPEAFTGIDLTGPDLWLPIAATAPSIFAPDALRSTGDMWLSIIGRLRPGVAPQAAIAQVGAAFATSGRRTFAGEPPTRVVFGPIQEARGPDRSQQASVALWVGAMALIVLLIACVNVTNLLLARGVARGREIGIRLAVGARPYRVVRLLLVEAITLAAIGTTAALFLALWGGPLVQAFFLPGALPGHSILDWRSLAAMVGVAIVAAFASTVMPAWRATRPELAMSLWAGARETRARRWRGIRGLLLAQTALSLVLLVGAGLFLKSLRHLQGLDLGFEPSRVLSVSLDARGAHLSQSEIPPLYARIAEAMRSLGGVQTASLAMGSPFNFSFGMSLTLRDRPTPRDFTGGGPYQFAVTPEYFETLGMTVVRGRGFTPEDRAGAAKVAVLNETLVRVLWPNENPIGQCVLQGNDHDCTTVIGVVKDTPRWSVLELHGALFYVPLSQVEGGSPTAILVRTRGQPEAMIPAMRGAIVAAAPQLPFVDITPLESSIAPQLKPWRLGSTMFTAYGVLALLLTALGLYGVLAYDVNRRTREIGVRMALGAEAGSVRGLVLREGLLVVGLGVLVGLVGVVLTGRLIAGQLFQESPRDPVVLFGAGAVLLFAATGASWLPARRATLVNPVDALRAE